MNFAVKMASAKPVKSRRYLVRRIIGIRAVNHTDENSGESFGF